MTPSDNSLALNVGCIVFTASFNLGPTRSFHVHTLSVKSGVHVKYSVSLGLHTCRGLVDGYGKMILFGNVSVRKHDHLRASSSVPCLTLGEEDLLIYGR